MKKFILFSLLSVLLYSAPGHAEKKRAREESAEEAPPAKAARDAAEREKYERERDERKARAAEKAAEKAAEWEEWQAAKPKWQAAKPEWEKADEAAKTAAAVAEIRTLAALRGLSLAPPRAQAVQAAREADVEAKAKAAADGGKDPADE